MFPKQTTLKRSQSDILSSTLTTPARPLRRAFSAETPNLSPITSLSDGKQEDGDEETSGTGYESDSEQSETHKVSFPEANATHPTMTQSIVKVEPKTLNCTIRIGTGTRPPTSLTSGQGRHVSAYALMLLVIKNRLNGKSVKDVEKLLRELISEYIKNDENLEGFYEEIDKVVKSHGPKEEEYQKRLAVYKADVATAKFLSSAATKKAMESLAGEDGAEVSELFKKMLAAHEERGEIAPIDVRNMMKRAQEAYSPFVSDLIAITITIFNRTTDAVTDFTQPTKTEGEEIIGESKAISRLQEGRRSYLNSDTGSLSDEKIAQDIAALFDYKYGLLSKNSASDLELRSGLYRVMRRHIKMVYDAFPFVKNLLDDEDKRSAILKCFADQILKKEGWEKNKHPDFKSGAALSERLLTEDKLKFDGSKCIVKYKSKVKKKHGSLAKKMSDSRGGEFPDTSNSGQSFFRDDESSESSANPSDEDSEPEAVDFITMAREGTLDEGFIEKYQQILKEETKESLELEGLDDEEISGKTISNDERFIALQCFLSGKNIRYQNNYDDGLIEILDNDDEIKALIPIEEITTIPSGQDPDKIDLAKEGRKQRFGELLSRNLPIYIPLQMAGHFTLLAIDPTSEPKTFRYIDSMKDSDNGDIPADLIFAPDAERFPYNPTKDLFTDLKAILDEEGFSPSAASYEAQQYSREIHDELVRRGSEEIYKAMADGSLADGEGEAQIAELEEDRKKEAHNNECGFLVAAATASMINKNNINANFGNAEDDEILHLNPILFIKSIRPAFDRLFKELRGVEVEEYQSNEESEESQPRTTIAPRLGTGKLNISTVSTRS